MSRRWLIAVSLVAHLAVAVGLFISGVWRIERVRADGRRTLSLVVMPPPPAPAAGPVAAVAIDITRKPPRPHPPVVTQPTPRTPDKPTPAASATTDTAGLDGPGDERATGPCLENCGPPAPPAAPVCGNGSLEADEQCDDGNTANRDGCSAACRIEVKARPVTATVGASVLQGLRISGETQIRPSPATQSRIVRDGETKVRGVVRLCISTDGTIASASMYSTTTYDDYDATLLSAVRGWRYQPYKVNGVAVQACSLISFIYTIR
jgi:cysteine-rich repeat protein